MKPIKISLFILCLIVSFETQKVQSQQINWTHFRGTGLNGISEEQDVPVAWNDSTHIIWETGIHDKGWSSPVVYDDQVWLTSASEDGKIMSGICLDFNTGQLIYDIEVFRPDSIFPKHSVNTYATPTPCIEDGFVYLSFGSYGTACINTENGKVVWKRTDFNCDHVQGAGSSPILYKNLIILHFEGVDVQYLVALDKTTGELVWKTDRPVGVYEALAPIGRKAYITPVIMNVNGHDLLISNGSAVCIAYNPLTGEEVWRVVQGEDSTIAMPVADSGVVYFYTGFVTGPDGEKYAELLAVDASGKGDVTRSHVLWRLKSPILQLLTPLIKDGLLYTVDTRNMLLCLDARTGKELYSKKLKQKYNASPVYAGGNIYFTSVRGETLVIKAGNILQIVAENKLPGEVYATPAILRKSILIRTDNQLYRIGSRP